jgi:hypothetical protein
MRAPLWVVRGLWHSGGAPVLAGRPPHLREVRDVPGPPRAVRRSTGALVEDAQDEGRGRRTAQSAVAQSAVAQSAAAQRAGALVEDAQDEGVLVALERLDDVLVVRGAEELRAAGARACVSAAPPRRASAVGGAGCGADLAPGLPMAFVASSEILNALSSTPSWARSRLKSAGR